MTESVDDRLYELATDFADDLSGRLARIVPTDMHFSAVLYGIGKGARIDVGTIVNEEFAPVPLAIDGSHRLDLLIKR